MEKHIQLDLNDPNSAKVAEIIGNKTCKKILGIIAEDENLSESDISNKLHIPLNTVGYNIKKLLEVGFIEKNKVFFWSVKGKKIPTYKLANKKIIISTKPKINGIISTILAAGIIGAGVKLLSNLFGVSNNNRYLLDNSIPTTLSSEKSSDGASYLTSFVNESGEQLLISSNTSTNPFHNILPWFIIGALAGLVLFTLYNYLKGGRN